MPDLKLEPGKYYRTRDGFKVYMAHDKCPFASGADLVGWIRGNNGVIGVNRWSEDGTSVYHPHDIIEEWKEPVEAWGVVKGRTVIMTFPTWSDADFFLTEKGWPQARIVHLVEKEGA